MNDRLASILKHPLTIPISVGLASFGGGFGAGYFLAKRKKSILPDAHQVPSVLMDFKVESDSDISAEVYDKALSELRDEQPIKPGPIVIDADVYEKLDQRAVDAPKEIELDIIDEPVIEEIITHNVFAESDEDWNYEEEINNRDPLNPYILHKDEFYENELDYTQSTLSYYVGDNIMCDEQDKPVYNHSTIVGNELRFGHGSGDPNVFYVRNHKRKAEYEIVKNTGFYQIEVLGLEVENTEREKDLKHSNIRRFRPD